MLTNELSQLRNDFLDFAQWHQGRSPMYHFLATCVAECRELLSLAVFARAGEPRPTLFFAAVQSLLAKSPTHELINYYPNFSGEAFHEEDVMSAFRDFCFEHGAEIQQLMATQRQQSTDVQRSALLVAGLSRMNQLTAGQCFQLIEVGCPTGLLLNYDRYAYDFGDTSIGDQNALLRLTCELKNQPNFELLIPKAKTKFGIDPHPVDIRLNKDAEWSRAFIPGDQTKKLRQFKKATETMHTHPVRMIRGEVHERFTDLANQPFSREPLCVLQCFTLRQPPPSVRHQFETLLGELSKEREIWRISLEWPEPEHTKLVLDHFYVGRRMSSELVATCHADGSAIRFRKNEH